MLAAGHIGARNVGVLRARPAARFRAALATILVVAGVAGVSYPTLSYAAGALRQARLAAEVRTMLGERPVATPTSNNHRHEHRHVRAFQPVEGQALGVVDVPSVGIHTVFLEGVTDDVLMSGPGHVPWTALPGSDDVSVLAAHRDAHFRNLKSLAVGEDVSLRLPGRTVRYRVVGRRIADPDERWVTEPLRRPVLRLVTCWPPNWIGPAPQRLVVSAVPVEPPARKVHRHVGAAPEPAQAEQAGPVTLLALAPGAPIGPSSLPAFGTAGAVMAAIAAVGALRVRRRLAWWFLPWVGGLGIVALSLLSAWAGPRLVGG